MLNKLIVITCLLFFCSCVDNQTDSSTTGVESLVDVPITDKADNVYLQPSINYAWQGNLDGKYPVLIWCKEIDGVVTGSLFYTEQKNGTAILLAGTYYDNQLELVEYLKDGQVTGIWRLRPSKHSIEGEWMHPSIEKTLSVSMMQIDTSVAIYGLHKGRDVSGEYHYYYKDDNAPMGNLSVQQITNDSVEIAFNNVGRGPAHNMGMIDSDTILLDGNRAVFSSDEFGGCELVLRFFNEFVHVSYRDDKTNCGLGHNVYLDGAYIKLR